MPCMGYPTTEEHLCLELKEYGQMLCQICRLLTKEQMLAIKPEFPKLNRNLLDWYENHLKRDYDRQFIDPYSNIEPLEITKSEIKRLGFKFV